MAGGRSGRSGRGRDGVTKPPVSWDMNFATRDYRLSVRLVAGLIAASVALLVVTGAMAWTILSYRGQKAALDRQMTDLAARNEHLQPLLAERDRLLRDLGSLSGLLAARNFSWTKLLTGIEEVFPAGAALEKLQYNPKDRTLVLEGRAQSPEALRNFMVGLEKAPLFKDPLLKHQSVEKGVISFTVGARYR